MKHVCIGLKTPKKSCKCFNVFDRSRSALYCATNTPKMELMNKESIGEICICSFYDQTGQIKAGVFFSAYLQISPTQSIPLFL